MLDNTNLAHNYHEKSTVNVIGTLLKETMLFYVFIPAGDVREVWLPKRTCCWDADLSYAVMPKLVAQKALLAPVDNEHELSPEELKTIYAHREYVLTRDPV